MILLVTIITSSAVVASSLIARYTACRSAGYKIQHHNRHLISITSKHNTAITYILMLEQLRRPKEQRRRLLRVERLPDIEQVHYTREQSPAFARADGGFIEDAGLLDDGRLVVVVRAEPALLILFRGERHRESREDGRAGQHDVEGDCTVQVLSSAHIIATLLHVARMHST